MLAIGACSEAPPRVDIDPMILERPQVESECRETMAFYRDLGVSPIDGWEHNVTAVVRQVMSLGASVENFIGYAATLEANRNEQLLSNFADSHEGTKRYPRYYRAGAEWAVARVEIIRANEPKMWEKFPEGSYSNDIVAATIRNYCARWAGFINVLQFNVALEELKNK